MTIAIPLGKGTKWGDNNELKYFLRSLDENLRIHFDVKLYAHYLPSWLNTDSVKYEIVDRYYPERAKRYHGGTKHYENYFDTLNKLRLMSDDEEVSEYFLYAYDDMILPHPITSLIDLTKWYAQIKYSDGKEGIDRSRSKWAETVRRALKLTGWKGYDYETHLPRWYNKDNLKHMFAKYKIDKQVVPYAPATLYGNLFIGTPDKVLRYDNDVKVGFYGMRKRDKYGAHPGKTLEDIDRVVEDKIWINYNDMGFRNCAIREWIEKRFPSKSKFEL